MQIRWNIVAGVFLLSGLWLLLPPVVDSQTAPDERSGTKIIWRDPGNVAGRDLRYGPAPGHLAPLAPFTFVEEDKSGESPKFVVTDSNGVKWQVKLGEEAQAETVATRLVWAVGYFAEETHYFDRVTIKGMRKLSRGMEHVSGNAVKGARFEARRDHIKRGETWDWDKNPFQNTHELNGLKVLMILLNNYDTRPENNRVLYVRDSTTGRQEAQYTVADLGATLGKAGGLGGKRSKNNLEDFVSTRFVKGVDDDGSVEFDYDTRPTRLGWLSIVHYPYYRSQVKKEKSMRGIPVEHARWIGSLLSQLTDEQLHTAFNTAGYDRATATGYVNALRQRINQLTRLEGRKVARP